MSNLRIALVAEGITDYVIIEAALKAILPRSFVLTLLQPEATRFDLGGGWGGVLKWCKEFRARGVGSLEADPTLEQFHLIIIHLDADVADKSYTNYGLQTATDAATFSWSALPCALPCPPPDATVNNLQSVLLSWLGMKANGNRTALCIPSKSSEAWLATAVFPSDQGLLADIECAMDMENRLVQLPKQQRIRKTSREYKSHAATMTSRWNGVRQLCSRANAFHHDVDAIAQTLPT